MKTLLYFFCACGLIFNLSCSSDQKDHYTKPDSTKTEAYTENTVIPWVNNLEVRAKPIMKSSVLAKVKKGELLSLTGEETGFRDTFKLEGKTIIDSWVKVKTKKHRIGWVFRGALKRPEE